MVTAGGSHEPGLSAFVGVAVVPMDREVVTGPQTVIIEAAHIAHIGDATSTHVPEAATVIDGAGKYLMPGLCDMHVHLACRDADPAHLVLYLAEGTTTVRSLSGDGRNIAWRDRVAAGELLGPTILTSGPTIVGPVDGELPDGPPVPAIAPTSSVEEAASTKPI